MPPHRIIHGSEDGLRVEHRPIVLQFLARQHFVIDTDPLSNSAQAIQLIKSCWRTSDHRPANEMPTDHLSRFGLELGP